MAYREVAMLDVKELLRLWMEGVPRKRIAAQRGLDPKETDTESPGKSTTPSVPASGAHGRIVARKASALADARALRKTGDR